MEMVYNETLQDYICQAGSPLLSVKAVTARPDYSLLLTFSNGEERVYDARPLLEKGVFASLAFFLKAKTDGCSVAWSDEVDIDPKHLYQYSVPLKP